jgi:hypothetical protein
MFERRSQHGLLLHRAVGHQFDQFFSRNEKIVSFGQQNQVVIGMKNSFGIMVDEILDGG